MEDNRVIVLVFCLVLLVAAGGIVMVLSSSSTGMASIYQKLPGPGGVENQPDPGTGYVLVDEGVCRLAQERYNSFLTFVQLQCKRMNPGRLKREGDCRYQAQLDAQLKCLSAPVFQNVQQPQMLV